MRVGLTFSSFSALHIHLNECRKLGKQKTHYVCNTLLVTNSFTIIYEPKIAINTSHQTQGNAPLNGNGVLRYQILQLINNRPGHAAVRLSDLNFQIRNNILSNKLIFGRHRKFNQQFHTTRHSTNKSYGRAIWPLAVP